MVLLTSIACPSHDAYPSGSTKQGAYVQPTQNNREAASSAISKADLPVRVSEGSALSLSPLPRPLSSFVGRRNEIDQLKRILSEARLVTLTGPGGCGKTRLAIELAAEVRSAFPDGIGFVDLAAVQDPATVAETVATALGLSGQDRVEATELIGEARLLLLVDNAEHLVDSVCQLAADLLGGSPNLRLLVTSRELLNIAGEVSWRVPPLQLPPEDAQPELGELLQYDAIQLFATRAVELEASFQLTEANAGFV